MTSWISVDERLPENEEEVVVLWDGREWEDCQYRGGVWFDRDDYPLMGVTHWREQEADDVT